jgi:hypothetical protein
LAQSAREWQLHLSMSMRGAAAAVGGGGAAAAAEVEGHVAAAATTTEAAEAGARCVGSRWLRCKGRYPAFLIGGGGLCGLCAGDGAPSKASLWRLEPPSTASTAEAEANAGSPRWLREVTVVRVQPPVKYSDEKVANRDTKVGHGVTENGP